MTRYGENPKEDVIEPLQNIFFINDIKEKLKESEKLKEETEELKEK